MFHDGGHMVGMHGQWWMLWLIVLVAFLFLGMGRSGFRRDPPHDVPTEDLHELLHRCLASGDMTSGEYEERKVLLDRSIVGTGV
jgi:uncharacterized membrane protein